MNPKGLRNPQMPRRDKLWAAALGLGAVTVVGARLFVAILSPAEVQVMAGGGLGCNWVPASQAAYMTPCGE